MEELPSLVADDDVCIWVLLDTQKQAAHRLLVDIFRIHPLLAEDALTVAAMPKHEEHPNVLYINVHGLADGSLSTDLRSVDVDLFLGDRFLITHHREENSALRGAYEAVVRDPQLLARGPAYVAHAILDGMIDAFLPLMEIFDREVEKLEGRVVGRSDPSLLERIFQLKHGLQRLHRIGMHQRELLHRLWRDPTPLIPKDLGPFYRDVYDHFVRVTDLTEGYREMVDSSLDGYLGMQSHRLNEIMKVLTIISTVMLPLTFITGLYGMNFDYMPGIHWEFGYQTAWVVMIVVAFSMFLFMKLRHWL